MSICNLCGCAGMTLGCSGMTLVWRGDDGLSLFLTMHIVFLPYIFIIKHNQVVTVNNLVAVPEAENIFNLPGIAAFDFF